jgi:hypothetical protein
VATFAKNTDSSNRYTFQGSSKKIALIEGVSTSYSYGLITSKTMLESLLNKTVVMTLVIDDNELSVYLNGTLKCKTQKVETFSPNYTLTLYKEVLHGNSVPRIYDRCLSEKEVIQSTMYLLGNGI